MAITADLRKSYRFMFEHAGWSTPPGRAQCALNMARAELRAKAEGIYFAWSHDEDADTSWMDEAQLQEFRNEETALLSCLMYRYSEDKQCSDETREVLASLGGIHVTGFSDPYCRVVEAELASELPTIEASPATGEHWHVATGLSGYGPDGSDGFASFETLSEALSYARDELSTFIDMAYDAAHDHGNREEFAEAWSEVLRMEDLETWQANLDPSRASAPLYANDPEAYAAMQREQFEQFPRDVSYNTRLYLWQCENPTECDHVESEDA